MKIHPYSFVRNFFSLAIAVFLSISTGSSVFAQTDTKLKDNNNFGALAKVAEKNGDNLLKRARIVKEETPRTENKSTPNSNEIEAAEKPQVISVTSSARILNWNKKLLK